MLLASSRVRRWLHNLDASRSELVLQPSWPRSRPVLSGNSCRRAALNACLRQLLRAISGRSKVPDFRITDDSTRWCPERVSPGPSAMSWQGGQAQRRPLLKRRQISARAPNGATGLHCCICDQGALLELNSHEKTRLPVPNLSPATCPSSFKFSSLHVGCCDGKMVRQLSYRRLLLFVAFACLGMAPHSLPAYLSSNN